MFSNQRLRRRLAAFATIGWPDQVPTPLPGNDVLILGN
jgi:hypothetical protein